ncbi:MAG: hypothetical protein II008_05060 [Oscillospiraceae bacterium]|nr:hypothetical protein [Oscillospiraceae bacterium]
MAKNSVTIDIMLGIPDDVADLCRKVLEIYLNQTPELDLRQRTLPGGRIILEFVARDDLIRVKRPDEMTPDHRQELGL